VLIGGDTVRIFNIHLHSYGFNPVDYSIIDSGMVSIERDFQEAREMGSKLKTGFQVRARQAVIISEYVQKSPHPVILCGDLNDPPVSYSYQQVKKGLEDAFVSSGKGVGRTYIGKLPSFRIDYIFYSNAFDAYNFQTHLFRQSDHLPVSCGLIRREKY
jgi:endonuclease/exonuclease/phosphatase family metal-dependent hydrolase